MRGRLIISLLIVFSFATSAQPQKNTALLLIDIQDFYFPGGAVELYEPHTAANKATLLLNYFRNNKYLVIHVRHNFEPGGAIHQTVTPNEGEKIISKDEINAFKNTDLNKYLQENKITDLVLCGMQTHMCLEAATRAASDFGYNCTVAEDACTTRDLEYNGHTVKAMDIHYSTLNTLKNYAKIVTTLEYMGNN